MIPPLRHNAPAHCTDDDWAGCMKPVFRGASIYAAGMVRGRLWAATFGVFGWVIAVEGYVTRGGHKIVRAYSDAWAEIAAAMTDIVGPKVPS